LRDIPSRSTAKITRSRRSKEAGFPILSWPPFQKGV
jgi:hypothetical protein